MALNAQGFSEPSIRPESRGENRIARRIEQTQPKAGPGMLSTSLPGGTVLMPQRVSRAGGIIHPWKLAVVSDKTKVFGGSCGSITVDTTELDTVDDRVWLKITFSLSVSLDGTWLRSGYPTAAVIEYGSDVPTGGGATHYIQIGRVEAGKVTAQNLDDSFGPGLCDDGSGTGEGYLVY